MTDAAFTLRRFTPDEWASLKSIRLEALREDGGFFGSTAANEAAQPDEKWKDNNPDVIFWGLYAGNELIGLTGIVRPKERREEALLIASYIRRQWRGRGLSGMLYEERINQARVWGCRYIIVSHREDNLASKAANQRFGFRFTHYEKRSWPDGTEAYNVFYRLEL